MSENNSRDPKPAAYTDKTIPTPKAQPEPRPEPRPRPQARADRPAGSPRPAQRPQARAEAPDDAPRPQAQGPERHPRPQASPSARASVTSRPLPRAQVARRRRAADPRWTMARNIALGALALLVVLAIAAYSQVGAVASAVVVRDVRPAGFALGGGANILIVGTDERVGYPGEGVRGDTLIVAHYDTAGRWAGLLSIPRDTQVNLLDIGATKINIAYGQGYARAEELYGPGTTPQEGGMALAAQTVEKLLDLGKHNQRIDYMATINFDGFARIIDALGGVTIDVPYAIHDEEYPTEDFGVQTIDFQPGVQRMDGERALIYARTRHGSSDFERSARQQQVVRAMVDEAKAKGPVGLALAMPKLRESLRGAVATTLPFASPGQLMGLLWLASGLSSSDMAQVRLSPELDPSYQEIDYNLLWSQQGLDTAVTALLTKPTPANAQAENARVQVFNATDATGLATKVSFTLEDAGFAVTTPGNAASDSQSRTVVYDVRGKPTTARAIAKLLGASYQQGAPEGIESQADIVVVLGQDAVK